MKASQLGAVMLQSSEQRLLANCWERIQGDQRAAVSPGDLLLLKGLQGHIAASLLFACGPVTPPGFICTWVRTPPSPPGGRSLCRTDAHITPLTSRCSNHFVFPQRFVFNRSRWNSITLIHAGIAKICIFFY